MEHKQRIASAFAAAAATYDAAAAIQAQVARGLADALPALPPAAKVLELGCGTGLLTARLLEKLPGDARLLATDLSPAMLDQARLRLNDPRLALAVMDAERPAGVDGGFDLIVSSLAAQWFADLPATLAGLAALLAPAGVLRITTLGSRTFMEWRAAHAIQGLQSGVPDYPDAQGLAAMLPGSAVASELLSARHDDARGFLRELNAIGAATPRPDHTPLSPGRLRRIMTALGSPCSITWDILTLSFTKDRTPP